MEGLQRCRLSHKVIRRGKVQWHRVLWQIHALQAGRNQVPDSIWFVLYLVTFMAIAASGYYFGLAGRRSWVAVALLVLTFSVVILLIADLDAPQGGYLQVSQQPLFDVIDRMNTPAP